MFLRFILSCVLLCVCAFGADIVIPLQDEAFRDDLSIQNSKRQDTFLESPNIDSKTIQSPITQSLSLHYLNAYMRHHSFAISTNGVGLEYHRILANNAQSDVLFSVQTNFTKASLKSESRSNGNTQNSYNPQDSYSIAPDASFQIGTLAQLDILFAQSDKGYHLLGFEIGYSFALPAHLAGGVDGVEFDEQSVLLNVDYGYSFNFGKYAMLPFVRLESYAFFPTKERARNRDFIDEGFNVLVGVKNIWDMRYFEASLSLGTLSDLNLSSSGVGVLANGAIVYDRLGMSNGIFSEISIGVLEHKNFHLLAKSNFSYMLSYYELNWQNSLSAMLRF
ncbi:hypothetical protein OQH61_01880 [Helicobacter sp. MIT 21-1697]|uniref:hypothetical protein n=1 Tax=Helicobacter sp. MIT 21-1697 TaxID=2993733 RepID=UPI00224B00D3|nr:hypothetical protein [Helicobacter sp. MIT 21-1697]MCX2716480.1 hypothetical protein [Helicobacter sp. MIT 21-1697]